jgi:hypothetical protein
MVSTGIGTNLVNLNCDPMRIALLACATILTITNAFSQKTEVNIVMNSGLFSFTGESAEETTSINYNDQTGKGYTNNPYGAKTALSYGLSSNVKRVTKLNMIAGADLGYEVLRSKVSIAFIDGYTGTSTYRLDATGHTYLNSRCINLNPFVGYRIGKGTVSVDVTGGFDFAFITSTEETGKANANNTTYNTSVDRQTIKRDVRPRIQVAGNYQKLGVYLGRSYGMANYMEGYVGGTNQSFARITRFGVAYKLME